jgi:hypothetical protein
MLALTSPTSGGRSVGVVRLQTKSHGVSFSFIYIQAENIVNYQNKNYIMNKYKITDFVLSQWFAVDVDYALGSLHSVNVSRLLTCLRNMLPPSS